MLISKTAFVKWNSRNQKRYIDLGYQYTKMGDFFEANVSDLSKCCKALVDIQCDYCKRIYQITWDQYLDIQRDEIDTDCCGDCVNKKTRDILNKKFGVDSIFQLEEVKNKITQTNLKKYGCINPFGNKEIQEKITKTLYKQNGYGKRRSEESLSKARATCMEKYGVDNNLKIPELRERLRGETSPFWKGNQILNPRTERGLPEYREWRRSVFGRDNYTCQCCGIHTGLGKRVRLEAHHIFDFKNHKDKMFDVDNGITLCDKCHIKFHSNYGKHGNDKNQIDEFLFRYKTLQRIKSYVELIGGVK